MKKAILCLIAAVSLLLPVSAVAAPTETGVSVQEASVQEASVADGSLPVPISVERKNIDGVEYLVKVYDLPADTPQEQLVEEDFVLEDFLFSYIATDKQINENKDTKEVTEDAKAEGGSKNLEDVIKLFPATKTYDKDGYQGTLTLDTGSIVTEVAGYTTKNYTVSATKEYPGLMYADPSYVAQSTVKDGYTLPLTNVSWTVMGTSLAGDTLVPTEYKAVATYSKTFSSQVPTGYVSTARYKGNVTKTTADTATFTITYAGKLMENGMPPVLKAVTGIIGVMLLGCAIAMLLLYLKNRQGADVYNLIDKEYICIGRQNVNPKQPVIDLNEFEDLIQSNVFQFVLDKKTTKALFGRNISVTYKDMTVKHRVNEKKGEYRFELDLGGVLDAE